MNKYEHTTPIHKAKADDINKHYAVGRWLLAVIELEAVEQAFAASLLAGAHISPAEPLYDRKLALETTIEDAERTAVEYGVNINELKERI